MAETDDSNTNNLIDDTNGQNPNKKVKIPKFDLNEENIKEKIRLKSIFDKIEKDLIDKNENKIKEEKKPVLITDQPERKNLDDGTDIQIHFKEHRKEFSYQCCLRLIYNIYLPIVVILNLLGIFQIISVMNVLYEVIKRAIVCYMDMDDKDDIEYYEFYNFYGFYFKSVVEGGFEYDLIETMSFLGTIFVKFYGFSISSAFFLLINFVSLSLIINFFNDYEGIIEKYDILQILYLIGCYILLFVGVGSSALLSQQILIDNYEQYSIFYYFTEKGKKKDKDNKEEEKVQDPYFILVCVTSVLGFLAKYSIDIAINSYKTKFDEKYENEELLNSNMLYNNITDIGINVEIFEHDRLLFFWIFGIYPVSIILSIIFYKLFKQIYEGDENVEEQKKEDEDIKECDIFGYMIYLKKYNYNEINEQNEKKDEITNPFFIINNENDNDNRLDIENSDEDIRSGSVTNLIQRPTEKKLPSGEGSTKKKMRKEHKNILVKTKESLINFIKKLCKCLQLLSDSFIKWFNEIICPYFCCCCNKCCKDSSYCCCCCCCECNKSNKKDQDNDNEYELDEGYFCYCYKARRNVKWFNRFIRDDSQTKIFPLLLQYFIIQLNNVAFEKKFDENNGNDITLGYFFAIFAASFYIFLYFTYSFGNLYSYYYNENLTNLNNGRESTEKLSNSILNGTYGIIIFNGFYSFIVAIICLSGDVEHNYYFYIPILINKFYYFTFAHQCTIYTDNDDDINYFTLATLLSIYLSIWDFFMDLIKNIDTNILLYFQLFLSTFIVVISLFSFIVVFCFIGKFKFTLLYFILLITPFGTLLFKCIYNKCTFFKNEPETCNKKDCLNKIYLTKENLETIKTRLISNDED